MAIQLSDADAMLDAIHCARTEGLEISPEHLAILERVVRGELTSEEAIREIIASVTAHPAK